MAGQLIEGGHVVFLASRSLIPSDLTTAGGKAGVDAKEVAQKKG
jgi:2-hydroxy-3-oxopropionate reductase